MNESKHESAMPLLHRAAIEGDLIEVRRLLDMKGGMIAQELNDEFEYPLYSALFLSAAHSEALKTVKEAIFRELLTYSFSVLTHQNGFGDTVLHRIVRNGFENLIDDVLALKEGAGLLFIKNKIGSYPIHVAILNGRIEIVKKLLLQQGIAEQLDSEGNSALHLAAGFGSLDMVQLCLEHCRKEMNARNSQDKTPLDLAVVNNLPEVQTFLTNNGAIRNPDSEWGSTYVSSYF